MDYCSHCGTELESLPPEAEQGSGCSYYKCSKCKLIFEQRYNSLTGYLISTQEYPYFEEEEEGGESGKDNAL